MLGNFENRPAGLLNPNAVNNSSGTLNTRHGGTGTTTTPTAGQILIAQSDGTYIPATLTQGTNVTITSISGSITIASSGTGSSIPDYVSYTYFGGV